MQSNTLTLIRRWSCVCSAGSRVDERNCRRRRMRLRVSWSLDVQRLVAVVRQSSTNSDQPSPRRTHTNCMPRNRARRDINCTQRNMIAILNTKLIWGRMLEHFMPFCLAHLHYCCQLLYLRATIALRAIVARRKPVDSDKLPSAFCPWRMSTSSKVSERRWRWSRPCSPAELMLFVFDSINVA